MAQYLGKDPVGADAHRGRRHEHAHPAGDRRRVGPAGHRRRLHAACLPPDRDDRLHPGRAQGGADVRRRREGQRLHLRGHQQRPGRGPRPRCCHAPGHGQRHQLLRPDRRPDRRVRYPGLDELSAPTLASTWPRSNPASPTRWPGSSSSPMPRSCSPARSPTSNGEPPRASPVARSCSSTSDAGREMRIEIQNENLVAFDDGTSPSSWSPT